MFSAYSFGGLQLSVRAMDELCIRRAIVGPDRAGDSIPAEWSRMVTTGEKVIHLMLEEVRALGQKYCFINALDLWTSRLSLKDP